MSSYETSSEIPLRSVPPGSGSRNRRALIALAVLAIAAPLAWIAGELHRENCEHAGKADCSVLPWATGHYVQPQGIDWSTARIGP